MLWQSAGVERYIHRPAEGILEEQHLRMSLERALPGAADTSAEAPQQGNTWVRAGLGMMNTITKDPCEMRLAGTIGNCRSPHFLLVGLHIVVLGRGIHLLVGKKKWDLGK